MNWLKEYKKWDWDSWVAFGMALLAVVVLLALFYGLVGLLYICNALP